MPCRLLLHIGNAAGHFTGSAARGAAPGIHEWQGETQRGFLERPPDTLPVQRRGRGPRDSRMAGRNPARVSRKGRRTLYRFSEWTRPRDSRTAGRNPARVSRKGRRTLYRFSGVDAAPGIHERQGETQRGFLERAAGHFIGSAAWTRPLEPETSRYAHLHPQWTWGFPGEAPSRFR